MPVLARIVEEGGIATVTVTMMPDIAAALRTPRIVGVEFPFGHPFGYPHDRDMQRAVAAATVSLLATATRPGARIDLELAWPVDPKIAYRDWQPAEPSPVVALYLERMRTARTED